MDTSTPPPGIAPEDWAATPLAVQHFLLASLTVVTLQQQQIVQLSTRVDNCTICCCWSVTTVRLANRKCCTASGVAAQSSGAIPGGGVLVSIGQVCLPST